MLNQQENIVFRYHIYTQKVNAGLIATFVFIGRT
jgi:hypothetical protein